MKKIGRTREQAEKEVLIKIYKYMLAVNLLYMKRHQFDADLVETTLIDCDDAVDYMEQQDDIRRSFCINSKVWRSLSLIRFDGGNRVQYDKLIAKLEPKLRAKTYMNDEDKMVKAGKGTVLMKKRSYVVGKYSKMYIFTYDEFIKICDKWKNSTAYSEIFDLSSDFYKPIIKILKENYDLKFYDFNKYAFRKDGSNKK